MKCGLIAIVLLLFSITVRTNEYTARTFNQDNKLFIITLDGYRWQELFNGADSLLLNDPSFHTDVKNSNALYWSPDKEERRKKLMPFFWNILAKQGEFYGNRNYDNNMNVANPYALSYPGYNELLSGRVDLTIFNNGKSLNKNLSVLDELNATATYQNKVAVFSSWDAFPYILNKDKSRLFINSGFENIEGENLSPAQTFINDIQEEIEDQKNTRYDELTYIACKEYIQKNKPSVVFLGFGGTDEAAHQKKYDAYLQQATNADRMIGELWQYLQTLPEYAGKTTFIITTDHGRGYSSDNWNKHGMFVNGSSQIWMGLLGPTIPANGERKKTQQLYLKNVKELMLKVLVHNR